MSTDKPDTAAQPEAAHTSIFDGVPEAPAAGANVIDEGDDTGLKREIIDGDRLKVSADLGNIDPFDHSAEQKALAEQQEGDGVAPPPLPENTAEPIRNPGVMTSPNERLQEEMEARFRGEFGDIKVVVTATDRDAFVRAALHDEELVLDIDLPGIGAVVKIAIPPDEFTTSASAAVTAWGRQDLIDKDSDLQWLLAFQQIHAWFQVRAINTEPTPWSDVWADGMPSNKELRALMRERATFEAFTRMNAVRWRMMLDAMQIAERKYKICMQNWRNRSFFTGADTD